ncbi:MAG: nitrite reductase small subunit NirD [Bacteroidetes bacterium]|nr:nitrite reductase small subunit NirD [Bacteroidota bacterium]MCW5895196.1 nitrite reductase small subunit NirD [Bacteroidota bacterium]
MPVEFIAVARMSDLPERGGKFIRVGDDEIALFKVAGKLFAINNVCAHQHISALHQGVLNGLEVTCPMHGWTYSLETGKAVSGSGCVKTYPVKIAGENVLVEIERAP